MKITQSEADRLRQWFNSLQDVNPNYIETGDRDLYERILKCVLGSEKFLQPISDISADMLPEKPLWWWRCECEHGFPFNRIENVKCPACGAPRPSIPVVEKARRV